MITPFRSQQVSSEGSISYGLTSFGYDIRCGNTFEIYGGGWVLDPKRFQPAESISVLEHEPIIIPPHGFALTYSMERLKIPRSVLGVVLGKSTYARCGLVVNTTPLEPEWEGYITLELSNTTDHPIVVYACEGIAQIVFHEGEPCSVSYADRKGRYQSQDAAIVHPRKST